MLRWILSSHADAIGPFETEEDAFMHPLSASPAYKVVPMFEPAK